MKLICTDLDGTLLSRERQITAFSRSVINAAVDSGCGFTIATARSVSYTLQLLEGLKITAPIILQNGVFVYDLASGRYVHTFALEYSVFQKALGVFREAGINDFSYFTDGEKVTLWHTALRSTGAEIFRAKRAAHGTVFSECLSHSLYPSSGSGLVPVYIVAFDEYGKLEPIYRQLAAIKDLSVLLYCDTYSDLWFLEVFSPRASKGAALSRVRRVSGADFVYGFGDNENDISMIAYCDAFFAVGNAVDALKTAATGVIGHAYDDGVALFLNKELGLNIREDL